MIKVWQDVRDSQNLNHPNCDICVASSVHLLNLFFQLLFSAIHHTLTQPNIPIISYAMYL